MRWHAAALHRYVRRLIAVPHRLDNIRREEGEVEDAADIAIRHPNTLCDLAKLAGQLTVVLPPWAARYDRAADAVWRDKEDQVAAMVSEAGALISAGVEIEPGASAALGCGVAPLECDE